MRITIDRASIRPSDLKFSDEGHEVCITDADPSGSPDLFARQLQDLADILFQSGLIAFLSPQEREVANKISAIKRIRTLFSTDLRTAKEFVDRFSPPRY
jgi:hypothetical protein